jgi:two-component system sensor kinase FixL
VDLALLESVPDAMIVVDDGGHVVHVNGVAERLFGWPRGELVGKPVEALLPSRHRIQHWLHRAAWQPTRVARPMGQGHDLSALRRDGTEFLCEISVSSVELDGRRCVMAAVRDVTERKKLERGAELWRKAREEVRQWDEFLSVSSHELRTPVTALQLQLQLLRRSAQRAQEDLPRLLLRKVEVLERQTRRISALVNELLDVSRMRLGKLELRYEDLDLADVAREVVAHLRHELSRSGSDLCADLSPAPGRWDRLRVEQVLTNLLVNAGKFGEGKPITLEVSAQGDQARIRVADRGIGIAAEHQSRVFDRFERAVPARHFGGLGLGLYVVRQIAEAHGGEVHVESAPGSGATFTVELPRDPPAQRAVEASSPA